jgi:hypothetical protein
LSGGKLAALAGLRIAAAVNLAIKRYERLARLAQNSEMHPFVVRIAD